MWNTRAVARGSWRLATVSTIAVAAVIVIASQRDTKRIDAQLAFADSCDAGHRANAEVAYRELIDSPGSSAYWYAMYEIGLVDIDLGRVDEAAEKLSEVAQGTKDVPELAGLHRLSTNNFVRAYAEIADFSTSAYPAFQRADHKCAVDMLETLADLYTAQGKTGPASDLYQELTRRAPTHRHVCMWQYKVARAYVSMFGASHAETVIQVEHLVLLSSVLRRKECHDNAAAMAGELARAYHRTKSAETLGYAERLYAVYLEAFPDAEDFARIQYFYAEVLWSRAEAETRPQLKSERWENAAAAFTEVIKTGRVDSKLMRESAYAAMLGWKIAAPTPENRRKLLAAVDAYTTLLHDPNDNDVVGAKLAEANTHYRYDRFDEAIPLLEDILSRHPEHESAEYAANLLVDIFTRLDRYDEMRAVIETLVATQSLLEAEPEAWLVQLRDKAYRSADAITEGR